MSDVPAQLVAFAAVADSIGDASDRRLGGFLDQPSSGLDAVLDSLASICVREGNEVYAVAIQFYNSSEGGKLTLTIAGNFGVPPQVVSHLEIVWNLLERIVDGCHGIDKKNKGKQYSIRCSDSSPNYRPAIAASRPLVADLKASIYRHSLQKFASRIKNRYQPFMTFMERLEEYMAKASDEDQDAWKSLLSARDFMAYIVKHLLPTEFQYERLVRHLDALNHDVRNVINSTSVSHWPKAVKGKYASLGCVYFRF